MAFNDLFVEYPNRNSELRNIAKFCYEAGKTAAAETSAAHTFGIDEHMLKRQRSYIQKARAKVARLSERPLPDRQGAARVQLPINFTEPYETYTTDVSGTMVPLNEETQLIAEQWALMAVELATSNSAALTGSLTAKDAERAANNLDVLEKILDEIEEQQNLNGDIFLDLPITAEPGAAFGPSTATSKK